MACNRATFHSLRSRKRSLHQTQRFTRCARVNVPYKCFQCRRKIGVETAYLSVAKEAVRREKGNPNIE